MTINRRQLFTEAWTLARTRARKSGSPIKAMFKLALSVVWATLKEAARRAALPQRPNAYEMGTKVFWPHGASARASAMAPIYNGW